MAKKGPKPRPLIDRLNERWTQGDDGCWLWTGYIMPNGYGKLTVPGARSNLAHRLMFEERRGPIPEGMQIDHLCRVRHCVNPDHLEPVSARENLERSPLVAALRKQKTDDALARRAARVSKHNRDKPCCPQGHLYDKENTRHYRGGRRCKACDREQHRIRYAARGHQ